MTQTYIKYLCKKKDRYDLSFFFISSILYHPRSCIPSPLTANIRQVYGNGLGEKYRKNASDIELSIDAIESTHKTEIDTYVFMTADSDMIPIMSRMIFKGKKVHLYYLGANTSQYQDITKYAHLSRDLITVFNIDVEKGKPEYWKDMAIKHMEKWYQDKRNINKLYGAKWLNEGLQSEFFVSYKLASSIIEYLEKINL